MQAPGNADTCMGGQDTAARDASTQAAVAASGGSGDSAPRRVSAGDAMSAQMNGSSNSSRRQHRTQLAQEEAEQSGEVPGTDEQRLTGRKLAWQQTLAMLHKHWLLQVRSST